MNELEKKLWQLPTAWQWAKMADVAEVIGGGTPATTVADNFGGYVPWITPADMSTHIGKIISRGARSITEQGMKNSGARWLPKGSILFSSRAPIGYVAIASQPLTTNQGFKSFVPERGITSDFVYYWLTSAKPLAEKLASGTTFLEISGAKAALVPFPVAPSAEQTRIVEKLEELLSDLDAGVAELKAAQKKLTQYRQSLLKAAVSGALTSEWRAARGRGGESSESGGQLLERILNKRRERWEARQLAKFQAQGKTPPKGWQDKYPEPQPLDTTDRPALPEGWFYCYLEALIPSDKTGTKTGPFGSLLKKYEHQKTGVPVIGIENIDRMRFVPGPKIHISPEKAAELCDYELLPGDIVISRSGTVGEVCVIPNELGEARFSTNIMRVRLESHVIKPNYLCLLLNGSPYVLSQIRKLCSGSTRDFLNTEILKSIVFPVPPLSEQEEILLILNLALTEIESQYEAVAISLKQSAAQRQNILKAAFSGQLVAQDPNDEPASRLLERIRAERASRAESSGKVKGKGRKSHA